MKKLERFFLSIIRRPVKTIILILVVFVAGNVITGSFIIYHATQKVSDKIHEQIRPAATIQTPVDVRINSLSRSISIDDSEIDEYGYRYIDALLEIAQFDEVAYADFGMLSQHWTTVDKIKNLSISYSMLDTTYDRNLFRFDNIYNKATVVGVYNPDSYYFMNNDLEIVEGRFFTEEEIREGKAVVILPQSARKIYPRENTEFYGQEKFELNEKIEFVFRIYDSDPINDSDFFPMENGGMYGEFTQEEIDMFQEKNEQSILYEEVVEAEVIGFYKSDFGKEKDFDIINNVYMPLNFYIHQNKKHNEKVAEYIGKGLVDTNNKEGFPRNYNFLSTISLFTYFELNDNSEIESFVNKTRSVLDEYQIDSNIKVNNDLYMKVAGPLSTVNDLSELIIIVAVIVVFIILSCLSLVFMKDRKKEIGILLSLGEHKRKVIMQMMAEILLVGLLGIAGSMLTAREFGKSLADSIISMSKQTETLSEDERKMMNGMTPIGAMNEYEEYLDDTNILAASSISVIILLASSGCIIIVIARMNPKDILL
ncbi:ABC transporter permease [Traorella massiliensis]|uniref:ABC transporter permease n=1 Tax=Traorella massiliensis TaxID=1903263 RepID=UPI0008F8185A|nr:ABC transporter permease [Traorella massiliensis]